MAQAPLSDRVERPGPRLSSAGPGKGLESDAPFQLVDAALKPLFLRPSKCLPCQNYHARAHSDAPDGCQAGLERLHVFNKP